MREKLYNILKWSEKYTKTDMKYLVKSNFWLTTDTVVSAVFSFVLAIAFANLLPQSVYGTYQYILSVGAFLGVFSITGFKSAIPQSIARGFEGITKKAFVMNLKWSIPQALAGISIGVYYFIQSDNLLALSIITATLFTPIINSAVFYQSALIGKKDFKRYALYNIIFKVIPILLLIGTLFVTNKLLPIVLVYFISNTILSYILFKRTVSTFNNKIDRKSFDYAKKVSPIQIINSLSQQVDKILIFQTIGAVELAIYSFAVIIPSKIKGIISSVSTSALPKFSTRNVSEIREGIMHKILIYLTIAGLCIFLYILLAPTIFGIFFPDYLASVPFSQVYIFILIYSGGLIGAFFKSQMAIKEQYVLNLVSGIGRIIFVVLFISLWGLWGALLGRIAAQYLAFFVGLGMAVKFGKTK